MPSGPGANLSHLIWKVTFIARKQNCLYFFKLYCELQNGLVTKTSTNWYSLTKSLPCKIFNVSLEQYLTKWKYARNSMFSFSFLWCCGLELESRSTGKAQWWLSTWYKVERSHLESLRSNTIQFSPNPKIPLKYTPVTKASSHICPSLCMSQPCKNWSRSDMGERKKLARKLNLLSNIISNTPVVSKKKSSRNQERL